MVKDTGRMKRLMVEQFGISEGEALQVMFGAECNVSMEKGFVRTPATEPQTVPLTDLYGRLNREELRAVIGAVEEELRGALSSEEREAAERQMAAAKKVLRWETEGGR